MTHQTPALKQSKWVHTLFLVVGALVGVWGFVSIDDSLNHPLGMGASWQAGSIIVLFSGMILGVALNNLFKLFRIQRKSKA